MSFNCYLTNIAIEEGKVYPNIPFPVREIADKKECLLGFLRFMKILPICDLIEYRPRLWVVSDLNLTGVKSFTRNFASNYTADMDRSFNTPGTRSLAFHCEQYLPDGIGGLNDFVEYLLCSAIFAEFMTQRVIFPAMRSLGPSGAAIPLYTPEIAMAFVSAGIAPFYLSQTDMEDIENKKPNDVAMRNMKSAIADKVNPGSDDLIPEDGSFWRM